MYTTNKYREYLLDHNYTVSKTNRICYSLESLLLDFSKILLILGVGLVTSSLPLCLFSVISTVDSTAFLWRCSLLDILEMFFHATGVNSVRYPCQSISVYPS